MSTNIGMGACCLSGAVHSGTPAGRVETVGDLPTYIAEPESKSKSKVVVFITDIFGFEFPNVRLLADEYAKAGFTAYIPDILNGDALPHSLLKSIDPPLKDQEQEGLIDKAKNTATVASTLYPWLAKHPESTTKPIVEKFIDHIRGQPGVGKIGSIGFCYGGRFSILAAHEKVDAAVACHPALLAIPGDFENVTKPLSLAVGSKDSLLDEKSVNQIKEFFSKSSLPNEVVVYEDQVHGFSLRSDWSSDKDKKAMDDTQKQGIAWFNKYLS